MNSHSFQITIKIKMSKIKPCPFQIFGQFWTHQVVRHDHKNSTESSKPVLFEVSQDTIPFSNL